MAAWLHLLAKSWEVPLTACRHALAVALLRTSSHHDKRRMERSAAGGCGSSPLRARGECSTGEMDGFGEWWLRDAAARAAHTSSPSPTGKDSETAPCAGLLSTPGSVEGVLDLLCGLTTVLGHEVRAAWNAGEDGLGETLELLLVAVLDTAEVITEENPA